MLTTVEEDLNYKTADHAARQHDRYTWAKYAITSRWLGAATRGTKPVLANIGCGSGEYNQVAVDLGYDVIACEPEKSAFDIAKTHEPRTSCSIANYGLFELADAGVQADFVVMHDVLEHIADESGAVDAIERVLKPGGRLVLSVPAGQWLFGYHDRMLGHYRRYNKPTLLHALKRFQTLECRYFGLSFLPVTYWYSKIVEKPYPMGQLSGVVDLSLRAVCAVESVVPAPLGTSLLIHAVRS